MSKRHVDTLQPDDEVYEYVIEEHEAAFRFDREMQARRFVTRRRPAELGGDDDPSAFLDATRPSPQYLKRLQKRPIFSEQIDYAIEEENAASIIEQPIEVALQMGRDFRNPDFIKAVKKPPIRRAGVVEFRGDDAAAVASTTVSSEEDEEEANVRRQQNDFVSSLPNYDGLNVELTDRRVREAFQGLALDDDDALVFDDNYDKAFTAAVAENETDETLNAEEVSLPELSAAQCAILLESNPFGSFGRKRAASIMQLSPVRTAYAALASIMLRDRAHWQHYNVVELIREMSLCGVKYDGCALARAPTKEFEKTRHCESGRTQKLCILKFFLVQANGDNAAIVGRRIEKKKADDGEDALDDGTKFNLAGFYDIEPGNASETQDSEADHQSVKYGTMHDIVRLGKVFMLCLRIVCVVTSSIAAPEPFVDTAPLPLGQQLPPEYERTEEDSESELFTESLVGDSFADSTCVFPARVRRQEVLLDDVRPTHRFDSVAPIVERERHTMPSADMVYTSLECEQIVGKPRAETFEKHVLRKHFGTLCVRSFSFYEPPRADEK